MLELLIPAAHAQEAVPAQGFDPSGIILMIGLFLIMYFMMIRPQKKRQKEHQDLVASVNKGDEVVMTSGLIGKITALSDDYLTVDTGTTEQKFQRIAIHAVLPKGTIKSI